MPDVKSVLNKFLEILGKFSLTQKILFGSIIGMVIVAVLFLTFFNSSPTRSMLFQSPLSPENYALVTKKLQEWNIDFSTREDSYIIVKDDNEGRRLRMRLGQEGIIPDNVKGWELFDTQQFTTTDFERNVNLHRAIQGEMERHLKTLGDIDDVTIQISYPEETLYSDYQAPTTASVVITPSPYSDITDNKKKIQGIVNLVAYGIPNLSSENVVVVDHNGNTLSDLLIPDDSTDAIKLAMEQLKIKEKERALLVNRVKQALTKSISPERLAISADIEFDWTKRSREADRIIPIVVKEDNPLTPYDDSEVQVNVALSEKKVVEDYQGPAYIPEGPAGTENNVPPGLKDKIDRFNHYNKDEQIVNYQNSSEKIQEEKAPYEIKKITVAVAIDGVWQIIRNDNGEPVMTNQGKVAREYTPVSQDDLKNYEDWVKAAIGFQQARGDNVVVNHIPFDHTEEFASEDEDIRKKMQIKKTLLVSIIVLILLFIGTLIYRIFAKEMEKKRRQKEEELARQQQAMREAALKAAEEDEATVELSIEEKARQELIQNAINITRERPEDVGKLIRTWMSQE